MVILSITFRTARFILQTVCARPLIESAHARFDQGFPGWCKGLPDGYGVHGHGEGDLSAGRGSILQEAFENSFSCVVQKIASMKINGL